MATQITSVDDVLNITVGDPLAGTVAANKVTKDGYHKLVALQNVTSYSVQEVLHACPRKFQLKKMQADAGTMQYSNSPTFAFGHSVGAGVAVYDSTQDLDQAVWAAFLAWDIDLLEIEMKGTRKTGKSFHEAIWALYAWREFYAEETDLSDYEVVNIEATIAVDFEDGHFYMGHIDEVLRHKDFGTYRIKENKTTGLLNVDPAMYSNSDQALSYAIVVDMLGGGEYEVLYTIYSSASQSWMQYSFIKGANSKAEWVQDQLLLHQQQNDYAALNFFPKRGRSCMNFMRRCEFYETCGLSTKAVFGKNFKDLQQCESLDDLRKIEHIDYATTVSEIVGRQQQLLSPTQAILGTLGDM